MIDDESEERCSADDSEYRLSDDSSSVSSAATYSDPRDSSDLSDSSDSSNVIDTRSEHRRRLHRGRQARYEEKKRASRHQSNATPMLASVLKRRMSSSTHISPALLPVVKAQVLEVKRQPVSATVIQTMSSVDLQPALCAVQLPLMSPLALGLSAQSVVNATLLPHSLSASSTLAALDTAEPFLDVSIDAFYLVLSFLHPIDILRLGVVSCAANRSTSAPSIWRPMVDRPWPISCDHVHDWKRVYCTRIKRALAGAHYTCTFCACTRTFKQEAMLAAHMARHSQQRTVYACTVAGCGLSFDTARRLRYHEKRHSGGALAKRVHACDWSGCTLIFPTPYALSLHRCRHTGEKRPHACKHTGCDRSFNSRHALALHTDTHKSRDERTLSFACAIDGCGRAFLTKSGLGKHAVKAHGEAVRGTAARVVCEEAGCGRVFHYRSEWRKHMRQRHKHEEADEARDKAMQGKEEADMDEWEGEGESD